MGAGGKRPHPTPGKNGPGPEGRAPVQTLEKEALESPHPRNPEGERTILNGKKKGAVPFHWPNGGVPEGSHKESRMRRKKPASEPEFSAANTGGNKLQIAQSPILRSAV